MTDETDRAWRAEFAHRYVARMLLRPPWPPAPVYVRPTDEEIEQLPEEMRRYARIRRDVLDALAAAGERIGRVAPTAGQGDLLASAAADRDDRDDRDAKPYPQVRDRDGGA